MNELGARILQVMAYLNLSKSEFAQNLGVSAAVLSHISSGRNKPGLEMVVSLLEHHKEISADWLLLGNGPMIRENGGQHLTEQVAQLLNEVKLLNEMNYNNLDSRIEAIKNRLKQG